MFLWRAQKRPGAPRYAVLRFYKSLFDMMFQLHAFGLVWAERARFRIPPRNPGFV